MSNPLDAVTAPVSARAEDVINEAQEVLENRTEGLNGLRSAADAQAADVLAGGQTALANSVGQVGNTAGRAADAANVAGGFATGLAGAFGQVGSAGDAVGGVGGLADGLSGALGGMPSGMPNGFPGSLPGQLDSPSSLGGMMSGSGGVGDMSAMMGGMAGMGGMPPGMGGMIGGMGGMMSGSGGVGDMSAMMGGSGGVGDMSAMMGGMAGMGGMMGGIGGMGGMGGIANFGATQATQFGNFGQPPYGQVLTYGDTLRQGAMSGFGDSQNQEITRLQDALKQRDTQLHDSQSREFELSKRSDWRSRAEEASAMRPGSRGSAGGGASKADSGGAVRHGKIYNRDSNKESKYIYVPKAVTLNSELVDRIMKHWNLPRPTLLLRVDSGFAHPLSLQGDEVLTTNNVIGKHFEKLMGVVKDCGTDELKKGHMNKILKELIYQIIRTIVQVAAQQHMWIVIQGRPTGLAILIEAAAKEYPNTILLVVDSPGKEGNTCVDNKTKLYTKFLKKDKTSSKEEKAVKQKKIVEKLQHTVDWVKKMNEKMLEQTCALDVEYKKDAYKLELEFWDTGKDFWTQESAGDEGTDDVMWNQWIFRSGTHYLFLESDSADDFDLALFGPKGTVFLGGGGSTTEAIQHSIKNGEPTVLIHNSGRTTQQHVFLHKELIKKYTREAETEVENTHEMPLIQTTKLMEADKAARGKNRTQREVKLTTTAQLKALLKDEFEARNKYNKEFRRMNKLPDEESYQSWRDNLPGKTTLQDGSEVQLNPQDGKDYPDWENLPQGAPVKLPDGQKLPDWKCTVCLCNGPDEDSLDEWVEQFCHTKQHNWIDHLAVSCGLLSSTEMINENGESTEWSNKDKKWSNGVGKPVYQKFKKGAVDMSDIVELDAVYRQRCQIINQTCVAIDPLDEEISERLVLRTVSNCFAANYRISTSVAYEAASRRAIASAWQLHAQLSSTCCGAKIFNDIALHLILLLGFLSLVFSVMVLEIDRGSFLAFGATPEDPIMVYLRYGIIIMPTFSGLLATLSARMRFRETWGLMKSAACLIETEIFKFRVRVTEYAVVGSGQEQDRTGRERQVRDQFLVKVVAIFTESLADISAASLNDSISIDKVPDYAKCASVLSLQQQGNYQKGGSQKKAKRMVMGALMKTFEGDEDDRADEETESDVAKEKQKEKENGKKKKPAKVPNESNAADASMNPQLGNLAATKYYKERTLPTLQLLTTDAASLWTYVTTCEVFIAVCAFIGSLLGALSKGSDGATVSLVPVFVTIGATVSSLMQQHCWYGRLMAVNAAVRALTKLDLDWNSSSALERCSLDKITELVEETENARLSVIGAWTCVAPNSKEQESSRGQEGGNEKKDDKGKQDGG